MPFATIVADPPWKLKAGRPLGRYVVQGGKQLFGPRGDAARDTPYPSMSVAEIAALKIPAADDAHLYLWTVNRYVADAYSVAAAWGFTPSTLLTWAKRTMGGGLGGAFGISTEFCLFCRRGTLPAKRRVNRSWFAWKRPYKNGYPQHSAKPPEFLDLVESVSPGPYLEMFARVRRPGWSVWGNEVQSDLEIA